MAENFLSHSTGTGSGSGGGGGGGGGAGAYRPLALQLQHHSHSHSALPLPLPHHQHHQRQHQPPQPHSHPHSRPRSHPHSLPLPQHQPTHTLASQPALDLNKYDDGASSVYQDLRQLQDVSSNTSAYQSPNAFENNQLSQHHNHALPHHVHQAPSISQGNGSPHTPHAGQFGLIAPGSMPVQHGSISRLQHEDDIFAGASPDPQEPTSNGCLGTKIVVDPPSLAAWRQKLFDVDEMIMLSEEEFQTYFPHIDNVYSHRSTQKYKRKPFVSHYWDCRLKGRPPGTPKSDDPNKKKRKRIARERDLCDVKIKITEYFPNALMQPGFELDAGGTPTAMDPSQANNFFSQPSPGAEHSQIQRPFGMLPPNNPLDRPHPGANGQRYWTIQRVNGNGGNGKGDGVAGPHKHSLQDSDVVKKSSVERYKMREAKERKKSEKTYHKKPTGNALVTAKKHSKEHDLKLFGSCFCPFVQRVWIALELKQLQYQYIEVDPYKKPQALLEVNPRGLVPGLRHGHWGIGESTVIMEYLEDLNVGQPLLPIGAPQLRATCRLWTDHVNRNIIPAFYHLLQAQDATAQSAHSRALQHEITQLVDAADATGPFFLGARMSFVDVHVAPWVLRCSRVLAPYRAWPAPEAGGRWARWVAALEAAECVRATTSEDALYRESYERYAENRPGTSRLADAVNAGRGLP